MADPVQNPLLFGSLGQGAPLFGSVQPTQAALQIPGVSPLGNMGAQAALGFFNAQSSSLYGLFPAMMGGRQNLFDQQAAARFYSEQQKAVSAAALRDAGGLERLAHGVANIFGQPLTAEQGATVRQMSQDVAPMVLPFLATQYPDIVDQVAGYRGSQTVMTQALFRAGQHATDAVTGRISTTGDTANALTDEIFQSTFGPDAKRMSPHGLRAGQIGMLQEGLQYRGLASQRIGTRSRTEQILALADEDFDDATVGRIAAREKLEPEQVRREHRQIKDEAAKIRGGRRMDADAIDKLQSVGASLRVMDARSISADTEKFSGAIAAMQDLFGDNGKTGTIPELLQAVENMTQQGLTHMSPASVEKLVRDTHQLAKQSGVSMEAVIGLTTGAAARADQLGINRGFANQAVQGALAYSHALGESGMIGKAGWGGLTLDQATLHDANLRQQAAASPLANQLAGFSRIVAEGIVGKDSESAAIAEAVRTGSPTYKFGGKTKDVRQSEGEAAAIMARDLDGGDGGGARRAQRVLANKNKNQEYVNQAFVREHGQALETIEALAPAFSEAAQDVGGVSLSQAQIIGTEVMAELQAASPDQKSTDIAQRNTVEKAYRKAFAKQGLKPTDEQIKIMAADSIATADERARGKQGLNNQGGLTGVLQMSDASIQHKANADREQAETAGAISKALSGLGTSPAIQRLVDVMDTAKPDTTFDELVAKVFTGIDNEEVAKLHPIMQELQTQQKLATSAERYTGEDAQAETLTAREMGLPLEQAKQAKDWARLLDMTKGVAKEKKGKFTPQGREQFDRAINSITAIGGGKEGSAAARTELMALQKSLGVKDDEFDAAAVQQAIARQPEAERAKLTQHLRVMQLAKADDTAATLKAVDSKAEHQATIKAAEAQAAKQELLQFEKSLSGSDAKVDKFDLGETQKKIATRSEADQAKLTKHLDELLAYEKKADAEAAEAQAARAGTTKPAPDRRPVDQPPAAAKATATDKAAPATTKSATTDQPRQIPPTPTTPTPTATEKSPSTTEEPAGKPVTAAPVQPTAKTEKSQHTSQLTGTLKLVGLEEALGKLEITRTDENHPSVG